ncbi:HdeD family acid-resistance protein [soil metagenome]
MTRHDALESQIRSVFRRGAWIAAISALLVGAFGLIFPQAALRSVALLFGVYLIVAGTSRVFTAVSGTDMQAGWRWFVGLMGLVVIAAGVLCLNNPFGTLIAIGLFIGIGWQIDGLLCIITAFALFRRGTRASLVLTGLASFVFGIVVILLPGAAILGFLFVTAIFLAVIGAVGIVSLAISGSRRRAETA